MKEFIKSRYSMIILLVNFVILLLGAGELNFYGLPLVILGAYIYLHNKRVMGKTWSIKVEEKKRLITEGLFKYVRHPLYLGAMIGCLGLIISLSNLLLLFVFIFLDVPVVYARALIEEEVLLKELKGYKEYFQKTAMFLPRVKINLK